MYSNVDYNAIAASFGRRYEQHDYGGVEECVRTFTNGADALLEVGCGTGHWLTSLSAPVVAGLDPAAAMLARARIDAPTSLLTRGCAEALPFRSACFDRVICINALHHFANARRFALDAHRVLRPGGGLLVIGLDPHAGRDTWWIYDHFLSTLAADLQRYPPTSALRIMLTETGFANCVTEEAQHMVAEMPVSVAMARGVLDRCSTSQLLVIDEKEYAAGAAGICEAAAQASASGAPEPRLRSDLRLYATTAWRQPVAHARGTV